MKLNDQNDEEEFDKLKIYQDDDILEQYDNNKKEEFEKYYLKNFI